VKSYPLIVTAEALAEQVTQDNFDRGLIYPPFSKIREISANIAANVAAKAYELGLYLFLSCTLFCFFSPQGYSCSGFSRACLLTNLYLNFIAGLATRLPCPKDLVKYAESCMYSPVYRYYR
jgi:malate dehydrogenase (oxaloacetate-decarboxylating)(NADP+)